MDGREARDRSLKTQTTSPWEESLSVVVARSPTSLGRWRQESMTSQRDVILSRSSHAMMSPRPLMGASRQGRRLPRWRAHWVGRAFQVASHVTAGRQTRLSDKFEGRRRTEMEFRSAMCGGGGNVCGCGSGCLGVRLSKLDQKELHFVGWGGATGGQP
ncbi:hypothetical protein BU23DRAFT_120680 [Bimuria novae-zelandiae CBS 107.79]|uniref:Uncharacterized protein n=1 Tax=Bimuria novae-zelandiae CBS 107.79 TaxID=1447943 RepID=A0A6A5VAY5_9PLEO|nr:hypothetical protein BU23DRAFT_120680 [Bimuria novae-zelandiae CBS 107.79]